MPTRRPSRPAPRLEASIPSGTVGARCLTPLDAGRVALDRVAWRRYRLDIEHMFDWSGGSDLDPRLRRTTERSSRNDAGDDRGRAGLPARHDARLPAALGRVAGRGDGGRRR